MIKILKKPLISLLSFICIVNGIFPIQIFPSYTTYAEDSNQTATVSTLTELQEKLQDQTLSTIIVTQRIDLPDGTSLDGHGKTIRVETPYIDASGRVLTSGYSTHGVFNISTGSTVTLENMTIMGGGSNDDTSTIPAVKNTGTLKMTNVTITRSNRGLDSEDDQSYVVLKNCNVVRNVAYCGGGIELSNGTLVMDGCSLTENRSTAVNGGGGAIEVNNNAHFYANNTVIANNSSSEVGGAINNYRSSTYLMNCTITGNLTTYSNPTNTTLSSASGGGIGVNEGFLHAVNSIFAHNYYIDPATGSPALSDIGLITFKSNSTAKVSYCIFGNAWGYDDKPYDSNAYSWINDKSTKVTTNNIFSSYRPDGILISKSGTSPAFEHSMLYPRSENEPYSLYAPLSPDQEANSKGVYATYMSYGDTPDSVKMSYQVDATSSKQNLGDLTQESNDQVTTYFEGDRREPLVIGASALDYDETTYYTVKLSNLEHGTVDGATVFGESVAAGASVTVTATPDANYKFKGWSTDGGQTIISTYNPYTFTVNSDVTLTPIFSDKPTVSFYADGLLIRQIDVSPGGSLNADDFPGIPEKPGYTNTSPYWEPSSLTNITKDITVNAVYTINTYTVTFMADGKEVAKETVDHGDSLQDIPNVPKKDNFTGTWDTTNFTNITSDMIVTAVYSSNNHTVTFMANGQMIRQHEIPHGSNLDADDFPPIPPKTGYTNTAPYWEPSSLTNITEDITVNAVYIKNKPGEYRYITLYDNIGNANLINSIDELINAVPVTDAEKERNEFGENIDIFIDVHDITNFISDIDKALISNKLNSNTVGMYLDMSMFKKVGDDNPVKLTVLNDKVTVSLMLPEELINMDDNITRTYKVIRLHGGIAEVIECQFDKNTKYITFDTDKFSTYAITYNDLRIPQTGDNRHVTSWFNLLILNAGFLIGTTYFNRKKRFS